MAHTTMKVRMEISAPTVGEALAVANDLTDRVKSLPPHEHHDLCGRTSEQCPDAQSLTFEVVHDVAETKWDVISHEETKFSRILGWASH